MQIWTLLLERTGNKEGAKYRPSAGKIVFWLVVLAAVWCWFPVSFEFDVLGINMAKGGYTDIGNQHWMAFATMIFYLLGKKSVRAWHYVNNKGTSETSPEVG